MDYWGVWLLGNIDHWGVSTTGEYGLLASMDHWRVWITRDYGLLGSVEYWEEELQQCSRRSKSEVSKTVCEGMEGRALTIMFVNVSYF